MTYVGLKMDAAGICDSLIAGCSCPEVVRLSQQIVTELERLYHTPA